MVKKKRKKENNSAERKSPNHRTPPPTGCPDRISLAQLFDLFSLVSSPSAIIHIILLYTPIRIGRTIRPCCALCAQLALSYRRSYRIIAHCAQTWHGRPAAAAAAIHTHTHTNTYYVLLYLSTIVHCVISFREFA